MLQIIANREHEIAQLDIELNALRLCCPYRRTPHATTAGLANRYAENPNSPVREAMSFVLQAGVFESA
jgi:hypothetical protein